MTWSVARPRDAHLWLCKGRKGVVGVGGGGDSEHVSLHLLTHSSPEIARMNPLTHLRNVVHLLILLLIMNTCDSPQHFLGTQTLAKQSRKDRKCIHIIGLVCDHGLCWKGESICSFTLFCE